MGPFDRFNDRAKRVIALSQDEAIRHNHNYIGTEHLILGLAREGEGVAAQVLTALGADLSKLRTAVGFIIPRGDSKTSPSEMTLSPRTKKVFELAIDEARKLGHGDVGTEHLLLGLVREGEGVACGILESLGISLETVRHEVIAALGRGHAGPAVPTISAQASMALTPPAAPFDFRDDPTARVVALAENEALGMGHTWVGTEHLLLGLIAANATIPQRILTGLGLTLATVRENVSRAGPPGAEWQTPELTMTPRAKRLLEQAGQRAGRGRVRPEALLVSVVRDRESAGAKTLDALNITENMILTALGQHAPPH